MKLTRRNMITVKLGLVALLLPACQGASVSSQTIPAELLEALPSGTVPDVLGLPTPLQGKLMATCVVDQGGKSHMQHAVIDANGVSTPVVFSQDPSPEILGSDVQLDQAWPLHDAAGRRLAGATSETVEVANYRQSNQTLVAQGPMKALLITIRLRGGESDPVAAADYVKSLGEQAGAYFHEVSQGRLSMTADVAGPYTVSTAKVGYNLCNGDQQWSIRGDALAAAAKAGINVDAYDHVSFLMPNSGSCDIWGTGQQVGRFTWINSDLRNYGGGYLLGTLVHEMGHNIGLCHAASWDCRSVAASPIVGNGGTCSYDEYGDNLDTMGSGNVPHYNAYHQRALGWLGGQIRTVTAGTTATLGAFEKDSNDLKVLRLNKNNGDFYYVEYRQPIGYDGGLGGVVVHMGNDSYRPSILVDMTAAGSWYSPYLKVGQTFEDPKAAYGGLKLTLLSQNSDGATLKVALGDDANVTPVSPAPVPVPVVEVSNNYFITSALNGVVIDDYGFRTAAGSLTGPYPLNKGPNQKWRFAKTVHNTYEIVNVYSKLCLDVQGISKVATAQVYQWTCHSVDAPQGNQEWTPVRKNGALTFVSRNSGMCLALSASGATVHKALRQMPCDGSAAQLWTLDVAP